MRKLFPILLLMILASCNTEKQFIRHYINHQDNAAHWCGIWFPPVANITTHHDTDTVYQPPVFLTTNCDSLENIVDSLKNLPKSSTRDSIIYVLMHPKNPCPPQQTVYIHDTTVINRENTAKIQDLQAQLSKALSNASKAQDEAALWRKRCLWLLGIDLFIAAFFIVKTKLL